MPATHFLIDGRRVEFDDPRLEGMFPRAYIELVKSERPWTGKPSVTQLLLGTREAFLRIVTDYGVEPDGAAYRVLGTLGHAVLAESALDPAEIQLVEGDETGTADVLERHGDGWWLTDYKVWGSFKVMQALGAAVEKRQVEELGKPVFFKNGNPKTRNVVVLDPSRADPGEVVMQLNRYASKVEAEKRLRVDRLMLCMIVRDGGTQSARARGIDKHVYYVEVPRLERAQVDGAFEERGHALLQALQAHRELVESGWPAEKALTEAMPPICSDKENWGGKKCLDGYCPVAAACARYGGHPRAAEILGPRETEEF